MRFKRSVAWLLALIMTLSVSVFVYAAETADGQTVVTIFHTNDVHGRFVADSNVIGIATVSSAKQATPNSLLVDAGDAIHGLPFATISKGADAVALMELAGYDVWAPGNHDFNYGYQHLYNLTHAGPISLISANIYLGEQSLLPPTAIKEVAGIKIGFIGLTSPETTYKTHKDNIKGLIFANPVECATAAVETLKEQGVDIIIALTHLGIDETSEDTSIALAEQVDGIDLIIDGHSHSLLENGLEVGDVLIASAGDAGGNLGVVTITFDADKALTDINASVLNVEAAKEAYPAEADLNILVKQISAEQDELFGEVIGQTPDTLLSDRSPGVRTQEMPLGNLVADALLAYTGADIAFTNGGGLRATINAGDITKKDIVSCLPFGNYGVTKYVTPADLKSLMENGVSKMPEPDGRFPQVAGFTFVYDPAQPVGSRIVSISIDGKKLDLTDNTTKLLLATNDFNAKGGDDYTALESITTETEYPALEEIVITYIQTNTKSYAEAEGRITTKK